MIKDMKKGLEPAFKRMLTTLENKVIPLHTALIVVDMQNDFCAKGGMFDKEGANLEMIHAMVPRLVDFIDGAREAKATIIFIQSIYNSEENRYLSDVWLEQFVRIGRGGYIDYPVCERNSWNADFYDGIKPLPGEIIINKHRYSAFINTDLDLILRSKGIRTLIMTGVGTGICVESTARDGFMKDYYIVMLKDCTASPSEKAHINTHRTMARNFGESVDSGDVMRCWQKG